MYPLTEVPALDDQEPHIVEVVVDRLTVKASSRARLTDSVETALKLADGRMTASFVDLPEGDPDREHRYSERLACPNGHPLTIDELEPRSFSFNSPFGACPVCDGLGTRREIDPALVVPDGSLSLARGAIAPWAGRKDREYFQRLLRATADAGGFGMDTPWDELTDAARQAVLHATGHRVHVSHRTRAGRERSYYVRFEGVLPWIERRYAEAEPDGAGETCEAFMRAVPCPACGGARLAPEILAVTVGGRSIADLAARPVREAAEWLRALALGPREQLIAERPLSEIQARLGFLADVGLDYLSLDRPAATLAGGEAQRIRLATQIGSGLTGVLYVLDEPSIGLHQRDNQRLIETLTRLRDLGNTLIVVEHDEDTIAAADWVVDIGPQAGEHGGRVVVSGTVEDLRKSPESITGAYLSGRTGIDVKATRRPRRKGRELVVEGAREHNLRGIDVAFPLGCFVAVTGVSGSGKSSLVNDIVYPVLANHINGTKLPRGRHTRTTGIGQLVAELQKRSTGRTIYLLDEPTTGLHAEDVRKLLGVLHSLVDLGNTVLVIEHNLDVIKTADWVIDLGPEAGPDGGMVVAEGTPEQVASAAESRTGQFLRAKLAGTAMDAGTNAGRPWTRARTRDGLGAGRKRPEFLNGSPRRVHACPARSCHAQDLAETPIASRTASRSPNWTSSGRSWRTVTVFLTRVG